MHGETVPVAAATSWAAARLPRAAVGAGGVGPGDRPVVTPMDLEQRAAVAHDMACHLSSGEEPLCCALNGQQHKVYEHAGHRPGLRCCQCVCVSSWRLRCRTHFYMVPAVVPVFI